MGAIFSDRSQTDSGRGSSCRCPSTTADGPKVSLIRVPTSESNAVSHEGRQNCLAVCMGTNGVCRTPETLPPSGGVVPISPQDLGRIQGPGRPRSTRTRCITEFGRSGSSEEPPREAPGGCFCSFEQKQEPLKCAFEITFAISKPSRFRSRRSRQSRTFFRKLCKADCILEPARGHKKGEFRLGILLSLECGVFPKVFKTLEKMNTFAFSSLRKISLSWPPLLPKDRTSSLQKKHFPSLIGLSLFTSWCGISTPARITCPGWERRSLLTTMKVESIGSCDPTQGVNKQ